MDLADKVVVVTGGASGIGRALAQRFAAEGARGIAVSDRDGDGARVVAEGIGAPQAFAITTDVSVEADVRELVRATEERYGPIDLFCSNAGIATGGGVEAPNDAWQQIWDINVMAHVYAARAVLPGMLARREGYLLNTASAAGLLSQIGSAPYAVTKHAAVAFAEWLSITHGDDGIKVSCLCPQGVKTNMLGNGGALLGPTAIEPEQLAGDVVEGLRREEFLILPHPEVREYFRRKGDDYERWLGGMRRLRARVGPTPF
ncbi:MAG TPA: SDR family NAD(P)-dependent oxidoreductase [Acidimicrobiales bacterium]|nr:SDR family NAD(P)-dependent oxidoreductase [Acidimicrobiales bacterium]